MIRRILPALTFATLAACGTTDPEVSMPTEYGWTGSAASELHPLADSTPADSVTISIYAVLDPNNLRQVDGILTIENDTALAYDPYEVLVSGFMSRDSTGAPEAMLAEFTRYDGSQCRMQGQVDSLGWWSTEMGCGGVHVDSLRLHPFRNGYVSGTVTRDDDAVQGARVWYCELDDDDYIVGCTGATYSGAEGAFRFEAPPGRWFVTFSVWDPIWDRWDHCRRTLSSEARLGRTVTVRRARVTKASVDCPGFI